MTFDVWNRVVSDLARNAIPGRDITAGYRYDALGRLIEMMGAGPGPGDIRSIYYTADGRPIEEHLHLQGGPARHFRDNVHSLAYLDALAFGEVRRGGDRLRSYPLQDANWNVTALVTKSAGGIWQVSQRFVHDPYGLVSFLNGTCSG